jgi:hypothetical protein
MTLFETIFQSIFTGICSYIGARTAKKAHKNIKQINIKKYFKKLYKRLKNDCFIHR